MKMAAMIQDTNDKRQIAHPDQNKSVRQTHGSFLASREALLKHSVEDYTTRETEGRMPVPPRSIFCEDLPICMYLQLN